MKTVEPNQYRVRGNWLHFKVLDLQPIQIPLGLDLTVGAAPPLPSRNRGNRSHFALDFDSKRGAAETYRP